MPLSSAPVLDHLDADFDAAVGRWQDLLRIPSIGTDPAHQADTRAAAAWLVEQFQSIGFEASLRETEGQPMVVGHHPGPGNGGPHILYYGHYDVQPADPIELWDTQPFEPTIVEGPAGKRMVARGAVDDKGQVMTWLEALRAWQQVHGTLPVKVSVFLEGEEESASPSLEPFLAAHRDELKADVCVVSDTGMWDIDTPAITTMLRGLLYVEIKLTGPDRDLHSGMYGGSVPNPLNVLSRILSRLHDDDGRVQIPGFYDDVLELTAAERQQWAALGFDEGQFFGAIGLSQGYGERDRATIERIWARPCCDVNGMWGGYTGPGSKTVIASHASAKLSCRLVADQDPAKILAGLEAFLDANTPPDCRWELENHGMSPAVRLPTESRFLQAAAASLEQVYQKKPVMMGMGGSIPAAGAIKRHLDVDSLLVGFGLQDDKVHSPNEKFEFRCFRQGARAHATMLAAFAELG